jgi:hypothetical protein
LTAGSSLCFHTFNMLTMFFLCCFGFLIHISPLVCNIKIYLNTPIFHHSISFTARCTNEKIHSVDRRVCTSNFPTSIRSSHNTASNGQMLARPSLPLSLCSLQTVVRSHWVASAMEKYKNF